MSTLGPGTATGARVATSTTSAVLLASAANKKMVHIYNDSATGKLYVNYGPTASATTFTVLLAPGGYYETPPGFPYSGVISGILDTSTGNAQITSY